MADILDRLFEEYYFQSQKVDEKLIQLRNHVKSSGKFPVGDAFEFSEMKRELINLRKKVIMELKGKPMNNMGSPHSS